MVLALIFLTACATSDRGERDQNFRTGTQGLYMKLVPNLPPPRVYDDQDLNIFIELENRGAHDLGGPGDRIYLSGFDSNIITSVPRLGEPIPKMEGKTQFGPGAFDSVSFKGILRDLRGQNIDKYQTRILVTSCYNYETIATAQVCIDPDPYSFTSKQKVCVPVAVSTGSQAAPIAVSSVNLEPSPGRTRFKITISNIGGGEPFRSGGNYLNRCNPNDPDQLRFNEVNYIRLDDVTISGRSIKSSCRPLDNNHIRLAGGRATIFCDLESIPSSSAYTTPLTVKLSYGYRDFLFKDLEIRASR